MIGTLIGILIGISFGISIRISIAICIRISILKSKWVYLKSLETWPRSGNKEWLLSSLQKLTQIYLLETSQNLNLRLNIWIEDCFWPLLSNLKNGYDKISTLEHLTKLFITLDWDCNTYWTLILTAIHCTYKRYMIKVIQFWKNFLVSPSLPKQQQFF